MTRILLRIVAAFVALIGLVANFAVQNPMLVQAALPPHLVAAIALAAPVLILLLHELAHQFPALEPAAPTASASKESP